MKISSMFESGKCVFSLEIFPPKKEGSIDSMYEILDELSDINPDFISVTYGAGGSAATRATSFLAGEIKSRCNIEPLMHLTCVAQSREEVEETLSSISNYGIENILALRGDVPPDGERKYDFLHSSDLAAAVSAHGFGVSGACYPEGHVESPDLVTDTLNLKFKIERGVSHLISQLFFSNDHFYHFLDRVRLAGIDVPIEAGIMPITNKRQIERMVTMCGASIPAELTKLMQKYENDAESLTAAGIEYAAEQISDLVDHGVDGIHLYTMNNPSTAHRIFDLVRTKMGR